jgi:tetratricopeptide (TPR) repeat protein
LVALQRYYTYAQEQLAEACGNEPTASMALYGMGKIHTLLARRSGEFETLHGPKAMAMHQAALLVDPNNYRAANELGVLLARYSQLDDARRVLLHSLSIYPQAESWHNLSVVHERLGENDLARRARYEWQLVRERRNGVAVADNTVESPVQWVDSNTFARISSASRGQNEPPPPTQPPAEKKVGATWWMPWKKATR